jgi:hypothetical protein
MTLASFRSSRVEQCSRAATHRVLVPGRTRALLCCAQHTKIWKQHNRATRARTITNAR